jgi:hypothetical protein
VFYSVWGNFPTLAFQNEDIAPSYNEFVLSKGATMRAGLVIQYVIVLTVFFSFAFHFLYNFISSSYEEEHRLKVKRNMVELNGTITKLNEELKALMRSRNQSVEDSVRTVMSRPPRLRTTIPSPPALSPGTQKDLNTVQSPTTNSPIGRPAITDTKSAKLPDPSSRFTSAVLFTMDSMPSYVANSQSGGAAGAFMIQFLTSSWI